MATMITSDCINCGACEPECPNNAISAGDPVYVIDPLLCTECVGFHDYEACAAVCPVDVCVTDPNNIESEEVLISRARELHKETDFGDSFQSRFRQLRPLKWLLQHLLPRRQRSPRSRLQRQNRRRNWWRPNRYPRKRNLHRRRRFPMKCPEVLRKYPINIQPVGVG